MSSNDEAQEYDEGEIPQRIVDGWLLVVIRSAEPPPRTSNLLVPLQPVALRSRSSPALGGDEKDNHMRG